MFWDLFCAEVSLVPGHKTWGWFLGEFSANPKTAQIQRSGFFLASLDSLNSTYLCFLCLFSKKDPWICSFAHCKVYILKHRKFSHGLNHRDYDEDCRQKNVPINLSFCWETCVSGHWSSQVRLSSMFKSQPWVDRVSYIVGGSEIPRPTTCRCAKSL